MIQPMILEGDVSSADTTSLLIATPEQAWSLVEGLGQRLCDPLAKQPRCNFRNVLERVENGIDLHKLKRYYDDFGFAGKFRFAKGSNGRSYVILMGDQVRRTLLKGTRYLSVNPKVIELAVGWGGFLRRTAEKVSVLKVGLLATGIAMDLVFGLLDSADLWNELPKTILKNTLSVLAGAAAATLVTGAGIAVLPVATGIVVGIAVDYGFDMLDARFGISQRLGGALRRAWQAADGQLREFELEAGQAIRRFEDAMLRQHM